MRAPTWPEETIPSMRCTRPTVLWLLLPLVAGCSRKTTTTGGKGSCWEIGRYTQCETSATSVDDRWTIPGLSFLADGNFWVTLIVCAVVIGVIASIISDVQNSARFLSTVRNQTQQLDAFVQ